jgi:uncharacterized protein (TIGR00266 family)
MRCHEVDYEIINNQVVEVELDQGETVIAEAGMMSWMDSSISFETKLGDGSADKGMLSKLFSAGKRYISGESLFLTHFTNQDNGKKRVAFSAPIPGDVVAIDLATCGESITCQKDAFLCAALGTKVDIVFNKKIGAGFFGGEGFILQKLYGDGKVFLQAGGVVVKKELNNETLMVDTGCLVGFSDGIDYDIQMSGGLKSMIFGGEGLFLAKLEGTGTVYLQSLPFARLADRINARATSAGGGTLEGSIVDAATN